MTIVSKPFKFFLLFVLLLVPLSQSPLDYFKLVLQWPPSNPKSNPRHYPKPLNFTIHGLWPESYIGWQPKCFPGGSYTSFTPASDQMLLQRLQMSWPDVQNGNNDWFWSHEWEDHGVYSLSSYNQWAYFTLAVDLKDRYDILWHLTSVNFKPGGTYKDEASIENAIMSCTTKTPELVCTPRSANTKSLLEVRICFDSNLAVMDCPGKSLSKDKECSQTKIFLPK